MAHSQRASAVSLVRPLKIPMNEKFSPSFRLEKCDPGPERPELTFDKNQFGNRQIYPVSTKFVGGGHGLNGWESTGLDYGDVSRMGTRRCKTHKYRQKPVPDWAVNDTKLRELILRFLEQRVGRKKRKYADDRERLAAIVEKLKVQAANKEKKIDELCAAYVAATDPAEKERLEKCIREADCFIRVSRAPHVLHDAVIAYYRMGMDSNEAAERNGLNGAWLRQTLVRMSALAGKPILKVEEQSMPVSAENLLIRGPESDVLPVGDHLPTLELPQPEVSTIEEWIIVGHDLTARYSQINWAIAAWVADGVNRFGRTEAFDAAAKIGGHTRGFFAKAFALAERFKPSERFPGVAYCTYDRLKTFNHEVTSALLPSIAAKGLTSKQVVALAIEANGGVDPVAHKKPKKRYVISISAEIWNAAKERANDEGHGVGIQGWVEKALKSALGLADDAPRPTYAERRQAQLAAN